MEFELAEDEKIKPWLAEVGEKVQHMLGLKKAYLKFGMQLEGLLKKKVDLLSEVWYEDYTS